MRTIFMAFLIFCSIFCSTRASTSDFFPQASDDLEHHQFWADTYFKPGTYTAVMNFRVWFKYPPDKVFKILSDTNNLKNRLASFKDSRVLSKDIFDQIVAEKPTKHERVIEIIGNNTVTSTHNRDAGQNWTDYEFLHFNFPWPVTDRWTVQKVRLDETNSGKGEYKYAYKMVVGNFKALSGYWQLVPVPGHDGWTEFRGQYESDPGIAVPKFVTKNAMKVGLKKDIESYKKVLAN